MAAAKKTGGGGKPSDDQIAAAQRAKQLEKQEAEREKQLEERQAELERAREQMAKLLTAIRAERVVLIDDEAYPVETYLAALLTSGSGIEDIGEAENDVDEPLEKRRDRLIKKW